MLSKKQRRTILFLSLPLAILLALVSAIGYATPDLYIRETANWQIQSRGQDMVDLFLVVPLLIISTILVFRSHKTWVTVWAATIVYIIYSFLIFCFSVHFNVLFPAYCLILGLSFYSILYFISMLQKLASRDTYTASPISIVTGIYLLFISVMFYGLWMSDIIQFLRTGQLPVSLNETGLPTNPVHVIDLSVFLPGVFITGIMLLKRKVAGLYLAPLLLIFFIIMNITIASLQVMLHNKGLSTAISIAWMMLALAFLSLVLFILFVRKYPIHKNEAANEK